MNKLRLYKKSFSLAGLIMIVILMLSSVEKYGAKEYIWFEAENAQKIVAPLQIDEKEGASGNAGIVAIGRHFRSDGYALYAFTTDRDGKYFFWGRCFWPHTCANSFNFSVDGSSQMLIGENPVFNRWHWLQGSYSMELKKGKHELILWNREHDSHIDKLLITSDPYYIPSLTGDANELYIDFEDGQLPGNFTFQSKNNWQIVEDSFPRNKCLVINSNSNTGAFYKLPNPEKYLYRLICKQYQLTNNKFVIFFNYVDKKNYEAIELAGKKASLIRAEHGIKKTIKQRILIEPLLTNFYRDVAIQKDNQTLRIKSNGLTIFESSAPPIKGKFIGFGAPFGSLCIDNISIASGEEVSFTQGFHGPGFGSTTTRPEVSSGYFERLKNATGNWWNISGDWNIHWGGFEALEGKSKEGKDAALIFGGEFWKDYTLKTVVKANGEGYAGIRFYFQDTCNYYLFKWSQGKELRKQQFVLSKFQNGKEFLLAQKKGQLKCGTAAWYKIEIALNKGFITIRIDDKTVFDTTDTTFVDGKAGFWTTSSQGTQFDDIVIAPTKCTKLSTPHRFEYNLYQKEEPISTDYADWETSSDGVIRDASKPIEGETMVSFHKKLFETSWLVNKKTFNRNFRYRSLTSRIPADIDILYSFKAFKRGQLQNYNLCISSDKISFYKDGTPKAHTSLTPGNRKRVEIIHTSNEWKFKSGKDSLCYKEDEIPDSFKIALGYGGMGTGEILIQRILIEDNLITTP